MLSRATVLRAFWALAIAVALVSALYAATRAQGAHRCEACMAVGDREVCRTVQAATREEAERGAIANACAILADGVTQILACERAAPLRLRCDAP